MEKVALSLYLVNKINATQLRQLTINIQKRNEFADHQLLKHTIEDFPCKSCSCDAIDILTQNDNVAFGIEGLDKQTISLYKLLNHYNKKSYELMKVIESHGIKYVFEECMYESRLYHPKGRHVHLYNDGLNYVYYDLA